MNQTRGALWGGKCGDRGRGGFDDVGALLVMLEDTREAVSSRYLSAMCICTLDVLAMHVE